MDIAHGDQLQWATRGKGHRSGGVMFKTLFEGEEGPGNYWLTLVRIDDYQTPPHRHNFDQVRLMLDGGFNFGPLDQEEGTIGYFPAGVEYAQKAIGPNVHLLLQSEGADGAMYLSQRQIETATDALKQTGRFADGTYHPDTPGAAPKDGFEAVWEHASGHSVDYVKPRYDAPIILDPARFSYRPVQGQPDVARKPLGRFSEAELGLTYFRVAPNAHFHLEPAEALRMLFVLQGSGTVADTASAMHGAPWTENSAFRLESGESITIAADAASELLMIELPAENFRKAGMT